MGFLSGRGMHCVAESIAIVRFSTTFLCARDSLNHVHCGVDAFLSEQKKGRSFDTEYRVRNFDVHYWLIGVALFAITTRFNRSSRV